MLVWSYACAMLTYISARLASIAGSYICAIHAYKIAYACVMLVYISVMLAYNI